MIISQAICKDRIILKHLRQKAIRRIWQLWKKRQMLNYNVEIISHQFAISAKSRSFVQWREFSLKMHKLRIASKSWQDRNALSQQKQYFSLMKLCAFERRQLAVYSTRVVAIAFTYWLTETTSLILLKNQSLLFHHLKFLKRFFNYWQLIKLLGRLAFRKRARKQVLFFKKWRGKVFNAPTRPRADLALKEKEEKDSKDDYSLVSIAQAPEQDAVDSDGRTLLQQQQVMASSAAEATTAHYGIFAFSSDTVSPAPNIEEATGPEHETVLGQKMQLIENLHFPNDEGPEFPQVEAFENTIGSAEKEDNEKGAFQKPVGIPFNDTLELVHSLDKRVYVHVATSPVEQSGDMCRSLDLQTPSADVTEIVIKKNSLAEITHFSNSQKYEDVNALVNVLEPEEKETPCPTSPSVEKNQSYSGTGLAEVLQLQPSSLNLDASKNDKPSRPSIELLDNSSVAVAEDLLSPESNPKPFAKDEDGYFHAAAVEERLESSVIAPLAWNEPSVSLCNLDIEPSNPHFIPESKTKKSDNTSAMELGVTDGSTISTRTHLLSQIEVLPRFLAIRHQNQMRSCVHRWMYKLARMKTESELAYNFSRLERLQ